MDTKIGFMGTTISSLQNTDTSLFSLITNLTTTGTSNFNLLGVSIGNVDLRTRNYEFTNDINILTLQNLAISADSRLDIAESNFFNLGTTISTHGIRLTAIETINTSQDSSISTLNNFCLGATINLGVTGSSESFIDNVQDFSDKVNIGFQAIEAGQVAYAGYQAIKNGEFDTFIATQLGINDANGTYQVLQDTEIASNSTSIGVVSGLVATAGINIVALDATAALLGTSSGVINGKVATLFSNDTLLGATQVLQDNKLNSFILGTTMHLGSLDSSVINLGTTLNY
jgi:hypothetical protein